MDGGYGWRPIDIWKCTRGVHMCGLHDVQFFEEVESFVRRRTDDYSIEELRDFTIILNNHHIPRPDLDKIIVQRLINMLMDYQNNPDWRTVADILVLFATNEQPVE